MIFIYGNFKSEFLFGRSKAAYIPSKGLSLNRSRGGRSTAGNIMEIIGENFNNFNLGRGDGIFLDDFIGDLLINGRDVACIGLKKIAAAAGNTG